MSDRFNWIDASRGDWSTSSQPNDTEKYVAVGALQRIARALEKIERHLYRQTPEGMAKAEQERKETELWEKQHAKVGALSNRLSEFVAQYLRADDKLEKGAVTELAGLRLAWRCVEDGITTPDPITLGWLREQVERGPGIKTKARALAVIDRAIAAQAETAGAPA